MKEYLQGRLEKLRKLYRDTGEGEYLYRSQEIQRAIEQLAVQEISPQLKHEHEAINGSI
jgi:hypothetical protein